MKHFIRKNSLNALVLVSAILSFIGYYFYYPRVGEQATFLDIVYSVLQLFFFNSDFEKEALNIYLNIARFLAPASLATVVIKGILLLFSNTLRKEQARRFKNHNIFCGDSDNLMPLLKEQSALGKRSIFIHRDEGDRPLVQHTHHIQYADFTRSILDDIAFYHSKYVIISNQNDLHSIENAINLVQSIDIAQLKSKIEVVLIFNNPHWSEISNDLGLVEKLNQQVQENPILNIRYINYLDRGIRKLLQVGPPDRFKPVLSPDDENPVALITGFNELSKRLLIGLALNCHYINHQKLKVLIHSNRAKEIAAFKANYQLDRMLDISFDTDEDLKDFKTPVDLIYLCNTHSIDLYGNLNLIKRNPLLRASHKIICADKLISKSHFSQMVDHVFVGREETDSLAALIDESIDEMAMTIHTNYLRERVRNKQLSDAIDTHKEWEKLSDETKDRNRFPADHLSTKVRAMNCELSDAGSANEGFDIKSFKYLEELSEAEHRRWCAYMYYKGWRHGASRDDELKIHPDLVPYDQLDDAAKKKDRDNILQIPELYGLRNLILVEKQAATD